MTQQRKQVKKLISNILEGDYKTAHRALKAVVEAKIKRNIVKASKKGLF